MSPLLFGAHSYGCDKRGPFFFFQLVDNLSISLINLIMMLYHLLRVLPLLSL